MVNHLDITSYYSVGTIRLLLPDPLFYLWATGTATPVRWMESRTATVGHAVTEPGLPEWGTPSYSCSRVNPICLFAGAAREGRCSRYQRERRSPG